jgi:membrane protein YdbS with pleckstrin-like domain
MVTMLGCMFVQQNNMSKEQQITAINSSILTIMFVVFLVLKLTGNIDWSWWWVTSPLWLPIVSIIGLIALIMVVAILIIILNKGDV